ncbi:MAG: hypothetical protein J6X19_03850 [Clostridia bacterium]|nr:hypothetical protein [Clostridia bacterium]
MTRNFADNKKRRMKLLAVLILPALLLCAVACNSGNNSAKTAAGTPEPSGFGRFQRGSWGDYSRQDGSYEINWPDSSQIDWSGWSGWSGWSERATREPIVVNDPVEPVVVVDPIILDPIEEFDPDDLVTAQPYIPGDAELPDPMPNYPANVPTGNDEYDYTVPQPGALLRFNLQNYTILTDTTHDWYTSARPTQKGLYQIGAEYVPGEGVSFTFQKNDNRADPMVYLPIYDICYNMNLRDYPYFAVCYKSTATNHNGVCYFSTANNTGLDESKTFAVDMQPSDDWTIAVSNSSKNKNWTGRLTQLRFDIASGEFSGEIQIKWIGFFKSREDAQAFGVNGGFSKNSIIPDKDTFDRGENITFSVTGAGKGDWVLLVQEGDACYAPSVNSVDLYVSECMPLYWAELEDGKGYIDIDTSGGIYRGELLPAGRYDLVYMPRGRFVETARTTITITDNIVREPLRTEPVYITRGPDPTATPEATEELPDDTYPPTATPPGRDRMTEQPTQAPTDNTAGKAGLIIALVAAAGCAAALAVFFVARRKRQK